MCSYRSFSFIVVRSLQAAEPKYSKAEESKIDAEILELRQKIAAAIYMKGEMQTENSSLDAQLGRYEGLISNPTEQASSDATVFGKRKELSDLPHRLAQVFSRVQRMNEVSSLLEAHANKVAFAEDSAKSSSTSSIPSSSSASSSSVHIVPAAGTDVASLPVVSDLI